MSNVANLWLIIGSSSSITNFLAKAFISGHTDWCRRVIGAGKTAVKNMVQKREDSSSANVCVSIKDVCLRILIRNKTTCA